MTQTDTLLRPLFWQNYPLEQLTTDEWEALCDGCGLCCLVKLEDDESHKVYYTKVACKLLDCSTGFCSDYANRGKYVPDCIKISMKNIRYLTWLPPSCAYKRLAEGKKLPSWHYLISGSRQTVIDAKKSVAGRCISELEVREQDVEDYIVRWVK